MIDTHAHVIAGDTRRYPLNPLGGRQSDWSRERPVSVEKMLGAMDEAGIEQAVLVQASTCYGHDNAYVADAVRAHPRRFAGVFSVDMLSADAPQKIGHWIRQGLCGLRVFVAGHSTRAEDARLDDSRAYPAWQCAIDAGLPVCVQLRADGLPQLEALLRRFPEAQILLDHMARPVLEDGPPYTAARSLFELSRFGNLFLKLTTHNVRDAQKGKASPQSFLARVVDEFGASRITWGSNHPASPGSLRELAELARDALAGLSSRDRDWIFCATAKRLYGMRST